MLKTPGGFNMTAQFNVILAVILFDDPNETAVQAA
jgi:hypothetical protein